MFPRRGSNRPTPNAKETLSSINKAKSTENNANRKSAIEPKIKSKDVGFHKIINDPKGKTQPNPGNVYGAISPHLRGTFSPGSNALVQERRISNKTGKFQIYEKSKNTSAANSNKHISRIKLNDLKKKTSDTERHIDIHKLDKEINIDDQHDEYGKIEDIIRTEVDNFDDINSAGKINKKAQHQSLEKKGILTISMNKSFKKFSKQIKYKICRKVWTSSVFPQSQRRNSKNKRIIFNKIFNLLSITFIKFSQSEKSRATK